MDLKYLTEYANDFLKETYNLKLEIPILINNRLRVNLASCVYSHKYEEPLQIELSGKLLKYGHTDVILDVLKHELVHYSLSILNLPSNDGDEYFEKELIKLGIGASGSNYVGELYICKCSKCNRNITTNQKSHYINKKYTTSCCSGNVVYQEAIINDGTF